MAVTVVHPISGQEISLSERQAVLAELEPVIDRIPNAPVTPAQTNIKPPIIVPSLGLMPYLKMGPSGAKLKKFGLGSLKNPVPDIEKVI